MKVIFREDQEKVMSYRKGIMSVSAVPGAGKTFILTRLVANLIKSTDKNEKILLLTYMNSAVKNFEERIEELIDTRDKLEIKTIHKFTGDLLRENIEYLQLSDSFTLVDSIDRDKILSELFKGWYNTYSHELKFLFKDFPLDKKFQLDFYNTLKRAVGTIISKIKMEGISYHKLTTETDGYSKGNLLPFVSLLYRDYQERLNQLSALDYDDMLFYAYKLLKENKEVRESYQRKYKYILEDEAQDSNKLQNNILAQLTEAGGNLVKVGDPNQSIMGTFTSASPEVFRDFIKGAPIKREMSCAGRSAVEIIRLANLFHKYTKDKHPCIEARDALIKPYIHPVPQGLDLTNPIVENQNLSQITAQDEFEEINKLVYFIKKFNNKYPDKSIGILVPRNSLVSTISFKLQKEGIEFGTVSDIGIETLNALKKVGDLVAFLAEPYSEKLFINLLKLYFIPKEEYLDKNIQKYIYDSRMENIFYGNPEVPEGVKNSNHYQYFKKALIKIGTLLEFSKNSPEKLLIYIGNSFDFNLEHRGLIENIAINLKKVFKLNPKWTLTDLANELKRTQNNKFGYFNPILKKQDEEEKKVTITNYHKSKGREWDMVYLFGLNSFYFPVYISKQAYGDKPYLKDKYLNLEAYIEWELNRYLGKSSSGDPVLNYKVERIAECIRLIFVGITRAREFLMVSHNMEKDEFYAPLFKRLIERSNHG